MMPKSKHSSQTDWEKLKKLSDKQIADAAAADEDAPLLTAKELAEFKKVQPPQSVDVKKIRHKLHLTQEQFAIYFGVNERTIQEWEQGRRTPTATARNFLKVIEYAPKIVQEVLLKNKKENKPHRQTHRRKTA